MVVRMLASDRYKSMGLISRELLCSCYEVVVGHRDVFMCLLVGVSD